MSREAADVRFVDDGFRVWATKRLIPFPIVAMGIGDDALHGGGGVVAGLRSGLTVVTVRHGYRETVRIEQGLARVEAEAAVRRTGPVSAIRVNLSGSDPRDPCVPVVIRVIAARV